MLLMSLDAVTAAELLKGMDADTVQELAVEVAYKGVRVNCLAPGWVTVENYFKALPGFNLEDAKKAASNAIPCAHYGLPIDMAKIAVFLCSEDARFIIGQTIIADGGSAALMSLISDFRSESDAKFGAASGYMQ